MNRTGIAANYCQGILNDIRQLLKAGLAYQISWRYFGLRFYFSSGLLINSTAADDYWYNSLII